MQMADEPRFTLEYFSEKLDDWKFMGAVPTRAEAEQHLADWREVAPTLTFRLIEIRPNSAPLIIAP